ncbi:lysophospholipid transporter LplT [Hydromonas duriensis]|uniref:Putative MFS family arabinose efflux permease n=1 Tax=Hydromonas duriensis TaxID=1527608 RepID=A0A4R6Y9R0_9BURK|nr:lysophospholipid transporter LplT [Hydromonas duriensis]TDR32223.1 putative MFS family arabinose efflux permease [Hydromonas duriensis]
MTPAFYIILAAQFFSSLADNALLIASIALLREMLADQSQEPLLKAFFTVSYVVLAPFVGAFADSRPKGNVMLITNSIKVAGCAIMLFGVHPMLAYAVVGLGAAAYSPAKYGIITELLPAEKLVAANGWMEAATVLSIIFGTALGGFLSSHFTHTWLVAHIPSITLSPAFTAITIICGVYGLAAYLNFLIPDTGTRYGKQAHRPIALIKDFWHCNRTLWSDKLGQISLAITTLLWGVAAVMQFIILDWAQADLGKTLEEASAMQAFVGVGSTIGAILAARFVAMRRATSVIPLGMFLGITLVSLLWIRSVWIAFPLMIGIGALAGFFLVPMNAMLQHRGYVLLSAGHSIAVQNFNENLSILLMLSIYAGLKYFHVPLHTSILFFVFLITTLMYLFYRWYVYNRTHYDADKLIEEVAHHEHI